MNIFGNSKKNNEYYKIFIAVFLAIVSSILVYFLISNINIVI